MSARIDLPQGTLDLLILRTLSLEPQHGWGISERVQQMSSEVLRIQQGSLYPALHRLDHSTEPVQAGVFVALAVVIIAVSALTYYTIEKPMQRLGHRLARRAPGYTAGVAASASSEAAVTSDAGDAAAAAAAGDGTDGAAATRSTSSNSAVAGGSGGSP